MPNKNKKSTGLTMFIDRVIRPEKRALIENRFFSIQELIIEAVPRYKELPQADKDYYEQLAKDSKRQQRLKVAVQLGPWGDENRSGQYFPSQTDCFYQSEGLRKTRKDIISKYIDHLNSISELMTEKFCLIGIQYMVAYNDVDYVPLELGLVEWNMRCGITDTYHTFINPGTILTGYRYSAMQHSEETHEIPLEMFSSGSSEYNVIWNKVKTFVGFDTSSKSILRPYYCLSGDWPIVDSSLGWLALMAGKKYEMNLVVLDSLEDLMEVLFNQMNSPMAPLEILEELKTIMFDFELNTKCYFHDGLDCTHCALAQPKKLTYIMSNNLSLLYNFELTENHIPKEHLNNYTVSSVAPKRNFSNNTGFGHSRSQPLLGDNNNMNNKNLRKGFNSRGSEASFATSVNSHRRREEEEKSQTSCFTSRLSSNRIGYEPISESKKKKANSTASTLTNRGNSCDTKLELSSSTASTFGVREMGEDTLSSLDDKVSFSVDGSNNKGSDLNANHLDGKNMDTGANEGVIRSNLNKHGRNVVLGGEDVSMSFGHRVGRNMEDLVGNNVKNQKRYGCGRIDIDEQMDDERLEKMSNVGSHYAPSIGLSEMSYATSLSVKSGFGRGRGKNLLLMSGGRGSNLMQPGDVMPGSKVQGVGSYSLKEAECNYDNEDERFSDISSMTASTKHMSIGRGYIKELYKDYQSEKEDMLLRPPGFRGPPGFPLP